MVGIGATGIQVIQIISGSVAHLTVFARTPQYVVPIKNPCYAAAEQDVYKSRFRELAERLPRTFSGFEYDFDNGAWSDHSPEARRAILEAVWADGSLKPWLASFAEMFVPASPRRVACPS